MERAVGWFVFLATALLMFGFGYYLYNTAQQKGWFVTKAPFFTYVDSSDGLKVKDPVVMMGFSVGQITRVHPTPPGEKHNVRVDFEVNDPYFRYLWTGGSYAKINSTLLGSRQLEVTRGTNGYALVVTQPVFVKTIDELRQLVAEDPGRWQLSQDVFDAKSNIVFRAYQWLTPERLDTIAALKIDSLYAYDDQEADKHRVVASWDGRYHHYKIFKPGDDSAWIKTVETPSVGDQMQAMIGQMQAALPGILSLTNKLAAVLDNAANATSNLNATIASARPMVKNFAFISQELRTPGNPLVWAMGTNGGAQVQLALTNANALLASSDTNLNQLTLQIGATLINLANITSNLDEQVQSNSGLLFGISKTIGDTDDFIQGLKRHWLLRSAFKKENKEEAEREKAAKEAQKANAARQAGQAPSN